MIGGMRRAASLLAVLALFVALQPGDADARRRRRARRGTGLLELNSTTEGADVMVDGAPVGKIPLAEPVKLPVGQHTLKMTLQGYTEYLDVFTIQRNKTTTLDIDLLPYAGVLQVTCNVEKARVYIDGKFEGTSPLEQEVLIGKRAIKVRKAGYYDYLGKVASIAGKVQRLHVTLKAMPVGSTPYRPPPPPPPKWYEKWYVWAGGAAGVAAITVAIVVPVVLLNRTAYDCDSMDYCWKTDK
jgi:hypothetical protein